MRKRKRILNKIQTVKLAKSYNTSQEKLLISQVYNKVLNMIKDEHFYEYKYIKLLKTLEI